jgi:hypothetical protein
MIVSLNEIQLTARKAGQGCGLAYGLAEEAGAAARFLSRSGLSVIPLLVRLLEDAAMAQSPSSSLVLGPSLGDRLLLGTPRSIGLRLVIAPALLPGYLSAVTRPVRISWEGAAYMMDGGRICRVDETPGNEEPRNVTAEFIEPPDTSLELTAAWDNAPIQGVEVEPEPWRRLQALAEKILTPESEFSRLHGAGAGLIDKD